MNDLVIDHLTIRRDSAGRFCLNDLHKAAGGEKRHQPANFLRSDVAQRLVDALRDETDPQNRGSEPIQSLKGGDGLQGTYVCRELVYAYAMWISPKFHLRVIRAFDALVTRPRASVLELLAQIHDEPEPEPEPIELAVSAVIELPRECLAQFAARVPLGPGLGDIHVLLNWSEKVDPSYYFVAIEVFDAFHIPYPNELLRARKLGWRVHSRLPITQGLGLAFALDLAALRQSVADNVAWYDSLIGGLVMITAGWMDLLFEETDVEGPVATFVPAMLRAAETAAARWVETHTANARLAVVAIRSSHGRPGLLDDPSAAPADLVPVAQVCNQNSWLDQYLFPLETGHSQPMLKSYRRSVERWQPPDPKRAGSKDQPT